MGLQLAVTAVEKDLGGGFRVRRLLPSAARRSVGPFVFFDHFGPTDVEPGAQLDVRPHPHIGLATVTFLFDGAIMHRDSLGYRQRIEPGAINWMHAGRGIVHSERQPDDLRGSAYRLHGLQMWVALPRAAEDSAPAFVHTPAAALPVATVSGATLRVLVGEAFGRRSPVVAASPTLYAVAELAAGARLALPPLAPELAVYPVDAAIAIDGHALGRGTLGVLDADRPAELHAAEPTRVVLLGGEPPDGRRLLWWNFVASDKARLVAAADDWAAGRFPRIDGDAEFIPLPADRPRPE